MTTHPKTTAHLGMVQIEAPTGAQLKRAIQGFVDLFGVQPRILVQGVFGPVRLYPLAWVESVEDQEILARGQDSQWYRVDPAAGQAVRVILRVPE